MQTYLNTPKLSLLSIFIRKNIIVHLIVCHLALSKSPTLKHQCPIIKSWLCVDISFVSGLNRLDVIK